LPVWLLFGAAGLLELAVTALLPLPAPARTALLVLVAWGLTVVAGFCAALIVHPHVVDQSVVRLRYGFWDELILPRSAIVAARVTPRTPTARGLCAVGGRATLSPAGTTNVVLTLNRPVDLNGLP